MSSAQAIMSKSLPSLDWGVGVGVAVLIAGLIGAAMTGGAKAPMSMDLYGELGAVDPQDVREAVAPYLGEGFFGVDVERLEQRLSDLPWVRDVQVQRLWPDRLAVRIEAHQAVAAWGDDAVLTADGHLIWPDQQPLSVLHVSGPEEQAAAVFADLAVVVPALPHGWDLRGWDVSATGDRRAEVTVADQLIVLEFGREPVEDKFRLLADVVLPVLKPRLLDVAAIDLRYRNGFAVRWTASGQAEEFKQ